MDGRERFPNDYQPVPELPAFPAPPRRNMSPHPGQCTCILCTRHPSLAAAVGFQSAGASGLIVDHVPASDLAPAPDPMRDWVDVAFDWLYLCVGLGGLVARELRRGPRR